MDKREYEAIGLRIRTVQRSLGLVDKDVAELLCIEVSSYRDMIHGRRQIGEGYFMQLCKKWNVSMDYLFYEKEDGGSLIISVCRQFLFVIPVAYLFAELVISGMCGTWLVWMSFVIAEVLSVIVSVVFMKKVNSKKVMSMS